MDHFSLRYQHGQLSRLLQIFILHMFFKRSILTALFKAALPWDAWVTQSVKRSALGFGSGPHFRVVMQPRSGALSSVGESAGDSLSLSFSNK